MLQIIDQIDLHFCTSAFSSSFTCPLRLNGSNAENEWAREGRRIIPLLRRATPLTAFTPAADAVKREVETENEERFVKNPAKTKSQKKKSLSEEQLRGLMPPPPPPLKVS